MSKPLVIYHGNCADGFSAAWCFHHHKPDQYDFHAGVYQKPPPDVTGREVFIVDFSYKYDVLCEMALKASRITILDHHASAAEDLARLSQFKVDPTDSDVTAHSLADAWMQCQTSNSPRIAACFDMNRSGATLAWDYLFVGYGWQRPPLLGHIEDRDLWRFKLPYTREIQANVFSYEYTFENWDRLMSADNVELMKMTVAGAAIERKHHKDIAELVGVLKRRMAIGGHDVPVASLPYTLVSDAANLMAQHEAFAACYWDGPEGRTFGLRSTDDGIDVSKVAVQYGGGGHPHAAGFKVPRDHPLAQA